MDYTEFKNRLQNLPVIISKDLLNSKSKKQVMLNQLYRWQKRGLIVKLKRGLYLLNKNDRKVNSSRGFIACQLYSPSYISLEYALNFYGFIPERVADVTSVTTKKTAHFENELGNFSYQHIKPQVFRGFQAVEDESGFTFFIADREKAIVDLFYLNLSKIPLGKKDLFEEYFRFQNTEKLKKRKIIEFAHLFNSNKLMRLVNIFCDFLKEERR